MTDNSRRILVTGASGGFGSALLQRLARRPDAEVVALDVVEPTTVPAGVEFHAGDVRDVEAMARAMKDCDVTVHLAWVVRPIKDIARARSIDIGGTSAVLDAMERTGCERLVFAASVTAYGIHDDHPERWTEDEPIDPGQAFTYGAHKAQAEVLIARSGVDALLPRAAVVVGRHTDNAVRSVYSTPLLATSRTGESLLQAVHHDDVGRFYEEACFSDRTGPVNLAAPDVLSMDEAGELLGKRVVRASESALRRVTGALWSVGLGTVDPAGADLIRYLPLADTTKLRDEWGFTPEYSTADALLDFRDAIRGRVALGKLEFAWRSRRGARA
ncbi:MAG: NAD-dependent epimerase/dehydratase family protein [Acidimicrobiia bacterium]